jgi:hypothetical protein
MSEFGIRRGVCWLVVSGFICAAFGCGSGPVVREHAGEISGSQTWTGVHVLTDDVTVTGSLRVEACAEIQVAAGAEVSVQEGGSVKLLGRSGCRVTVTSSKSSPAAGDWESIDIYSSSNNDNQFEYVTVEYGGAEGDYGMVWVEDGARVAMEEVVLRHSGSNGAYFEQGADIASLTGVQASDVAASALRVAPNDAGAVGDVSSSDGARVRLAGGTVSESQTWVAPGTPYYVDGDVTVTSDLQVGAGTTLEMGAGTLVEVNDGGTIQLRGANGDRVVVRSAKSSPSPGDWARFDIYESAGSPNSFSYTDIKHAGSDPTYGALWVDENLTVSLDQVLFESNQSCDVYVKGTVNASMADYTACN